MLPLVMLTLTGAIGLVAWAKSTTDEMVLVRKKENAAALEAANPGMQIFNPARPEPELYLDPRIAQAAKDGAPWAKSWGRAMYELHKDNLPPLR